MILETLKNKLLTLGIPGLLLISFLDSAGVPLPGGADLVVMLLSWQRPAHLFLIAVVAALGSVLGSLVLYHIARTKGDAMMSRFPKDKQDRVKEKFRRNDILAVLVAMLAPPPLPTKLFVLVAGAVRMDWRRFVATLFAGRLIRFLGEAYLAVKLGDRTAETLRQHYPSIAGALAAAVVLYFLMRRFVQRRPERRGGLSAYDRDADIGSVKPPEAPESDRARVAQAAVRRGGGPGRCGCREYDHHVAVTPVAAHPPAWCARRAFEIIVAMDRFALPLAPSRLSTHRQRSTAAENCPCNCPWEAPKQGFQGQRQPTRSICEVKETEGFARTIEDVREADFRLANHRLQPLGHLTAARFLGIRQRAGYGNPDSVVIVPEIVPVTGPIDGNGSARSYLLAPPQKVAVLS